MKQIQTEKQMIKFMKGKTPYEKIVLQWLFDYSEPSSADENDIEFGKMLYAMVDHICEDGFNSYDYKEFAKKMPEKMTIAQANAYHRFPSIVRSLFNKYA